MSLRFEQLYEIMNRCISLRYNTYLFKSNLLVLRNNHIVYKANIQSFITFSDSGKMNFSKILLIIKFLIIRIVLIF